MSKNLSDNLSPNEIALIMSDTKDIRTVSDSFVDNMSAMLEKSITYIDNSELINNEPDENNTAS